MATPYMMTRERWCSTSIISKVSIGWSIQPAKDEKKL